MEASGTNLRGFLFEEAKMTKKEEKVYQDTEILKEILLRTLAGRKFRLDCGHHVTFGHSLGNNITVYNGKTFKIICSQCGY